MHRERERDTERVWELLGERERERGEGGSSKEGIRERELLNEMGNARGKIETERIEERKRNITEREREREREKETQKSVGVASGEREREK